VARPSPPLADPIEAEVFRHRFVSVAEEMGVTLERTAFSPNIKERRDHSCAVFDRAGRLLAQAAHIPVHLGAFPLLMRELVPHFRWRPGDVVICNDPFVGGTHLPDVSLVSPVFTPAGRLAGFVANRAHHADLGGAYAGSMSPTTELYQEGVVIPPLKLVEAGRPRAELLELLLRNVRTPDERRGDLAAQQAANAVGARRFEALLRQYGAATVTRRAAAERTRTAAAVRAVVAALPAGCFRFEDWLDDDGHGSGPLPIRVALTREGERLRCDFTGTAPQQRGCVNATLAVTWSAVLYCLICLLPDEVSLNEGLFEALEVVAPPASLVRAAAPAAVAAGNVETSQRIVDVVFGALAQALPDRIPAASQGTMNNVALGGIEPGSGRPWAYYETLGGGSGGSPRGPGASGLHCHMSNTRNTPAEALEYHYPLRVRGYALRRGSGGPGRHAGGDGVTRELELLAEATASLLTDRRARGPYGLAGGEAGKPGANSVLGGSDAESVPGKAVLRLPAGTRLRIETPGGGGWGAPERRKPAPKSCPAVSQGDRSATG
jgi:N-methylhydantoinase B